MHNFLRLINTVKYLKFTQITYQIFDRMRSVIRRRYGFHYLTTIPSKSFELKLELSIASATSNNEFSFSFLNLNHDFVENIDWNYSKFGKLWTYNLTYFDYLQQKEMDRSSGELLIHNFIDQMEMVKDGLEGFPISLRGVNWIKFLSHHKIKDQKIDDALLAQYYILIDNLEFHLLGNHLLENAFSLLFGAYYFQNEELYSKAKKILVKELKEQILDDGAHFELSPMYHQLILFRILDCINLAKNNPYKNQELLVYFEEKAKDMFGWINTMTFRNGDIPLFNDSANGIAPTTSQLNNYAKELCINNQLAFTHLQLSKSGYRKFKNLNYEIIMDVGNIGPDYIPGHAHADTFNFVLYINSSVSHQQSTTNNQPFIVDTGISTYEKNRIRHLERSTESHNTVTVNNKNQSQVWSGFRVAKRAKIIELVEKENQIIASHDGYKSLGIIHKRSFTSKKDTIEIKDSLSGKEIGGDAYLHFHPLIENIIIKDGHVNFPELACQINFEGINLNVERKTYNYAVGFNKTQKSTVIKIHFIGELVTIISGYSDN